MAVCVHDMRRWGHATTHPLLPHSSVTVSSSATPVKRGPGPGGGAAVLRCCCGAVAGASTVSTTARMPCPDAHRLLLLNGWLQALFSCCRFQRACEVGQRARATPSTLLQADACEFTRAMVAPVPLMAAIINAPLEQAFSWLADE